LALGYRYGGQIPYRIAQIYGTMGVADSAAVWLDRALAAGWDDPAGIQGDDAFSALLDHPRLASLRTQPEGLTREEGWRLDIDYLVAEAQRMHADPDRPAFSSGFEAAAAALKAAVPELSNDEIVIELQKLTTLLGDGHSGIYGPGPDSPLRFSARSLPFKFYAFSDGLFIVDAVGEARRWIGSRVVAFGARPTEDLLEDLRQLVHHDNDMTPLWLGVHHSLPSLAALKALGATSDSASVQLSVEDPGGVIHDIEVPAGDYVDFPRKLHPPTGQDQPPLWIRNVDRAYWLQALPEADAVYWQFNQVRDADGGPSLGAFADTLREALSATAASTLIVDVRHNNGATTVSSLLSCGPLVWWEQDAPDHRIFIITGRGHLFRSAEFHQPPGAMDRRRIRGGALVLTAQLRGEETPLILPYSRVRGSISNRYWQDSDPDDDRPWIAPQVPVSLSSRDYFTGVDPALEAIITLRQQEEVR
jgi:hypothetical protein